MISRLPAAVIALAMGAALFVSACTSSSTSSSATSSSSAKPSSTHQSGFQVGPNPCGLVTTQEILTAMNVRMTKTTASKSTCTYTGAKANSSVSVTTATMSPSGARKAVLGTAQAAKVKIQHLSGLGGTAVAYLTTAPNLNIATCLVAKNGTFLFLHADSPHPAHLIQSGIALCRTAASRI